MVTVILDIIELTLLIFDIKYEQQCAWVKLVVVNPVGFPRTRISCQPINRDCKGKKRDCRDLFFTIEYDRVIGRKLRHYSVVETLLSCRYLLTRRGELRLNRGGFLGVMKLPIHVYLICRLPYMSKKLLLLHT